MKNFFLSIASFILVATTGLAQTTASTATTNKQKVFTPHMPDETSVVKDSTGKVVPYEQWQAIIKDGRHGLRSKSNEPENQFTIFSLSAIQIEANRQRAAAQGVLRQKAIEAQAAGQPASEMKTMYVPPLPAQSKFFVNGEKINPVKVTDMQGNKLDMKKMTGKVIVLNFWFIGCPPCRNEIPELNKLVDEYAQNPDVVFIAIGLDKRYQVKKFLEQIPYKYQIVDDARYYADNYGVTLYPTNVVIDKTGTVKFSSSGFSSAVPYWIKRNIDESLTATN